jgi:hypothetical protein
MDKAKEFIEPIIGANDEDSAVEVLVDITEKLHLSRNYFHLVSLKDKMEESKEKFKEITDRYKKIPVPRSYTSLHELRVELSFLSRDFTDELAFEINKCKIFHEERKTEARAAGILDLKEDKEFNEKFDRKLSATAIRELVGASDVYQEYINLASYSYGLYQEYHKISDTMKLFNDALASECREAQWHNQKDAK